MIFFEKCDTIEAKCINCLKNLSLNFIKIFSFHISCTNLFLLKRIKINIIFILYFNYDFVEFHPISDIVDAFLKCGS